MQQSERRGLFAGYINDAVISPDGSALAVVIMHSGPQSDTTSVAQFSATTSKQTRVLYQVPTGSGFSYRFFSSDLPAVTCYSMSAPPAGQSTAGSITGNWSG